MSGFMCAYNRINGHYACANNHTLNTMLRDYAGFTGFVVSDWGATHSTARSLNSGLDIDMPDPKWFSETLIQEAIANGTVSEDRVHESCLRILGKWYELPEDKRYPCGGGNCLHANVSTPENKQLAREIAAKSTVLLKNDGGLLPLSSPTDATGHCPRSDWSGRDRKKLHGGTGLWQRAKLSTNGLCANSVRPDRAQDLLSMGLIWQGKDCG